eukprot:CAMPEP_0206197740 /NCGR_PEP_ID=MMETSP0166-20121206/9228_1 /ASSEMBLY_ACC=CAM_ASM_000260 /TAXON_ID=95228 /ORGANISM="Vannella robusta, Strain DIVA3 518/3/11/1/6" /LENGTH=340 /DNA_ID=CAMNT_0053615473 /DNA_START=147 /DNA_END=1165 /DNA_ORIENTATION=+
MTRKSFRQEFRLPDLDLHAPLQKFMRTHPHHFLPYAASAYIYHTERNEQKATELYEFAHQLADEYPEVNRPFISLLPRHDQFFVDSCNAELSELVPKTIWTIQGLFYSTHDDPSPIDLQSSVVRLEDGDIIIINPLQFNRQKNSDEIIESINSLGDVAAIISSTATHGIAIEECHKIWQGNKHGNPRLPWSGFLRESEQLFEPDLFHYQIKGQNWNETVFYHPATKVLLGLADLGISPLHSFRSWSMVAYCLSMGMWRGSKTTSIALQNYQTIMITDREAFRESWAGVLLLDVEAIVLGHGGILKGNQASQQLRESLLWIIESSQGLSLFEKIYLPPLYA